MLQPVRVQEIIMDDTHRMYSGEASIGRIMYSEIGQSVVYADVWTPFTARPLHFNISHLPVSQEIVLLVGGPKDSFMSTGENEPYYIGPLNIHSNPSSGQLPTVLNEEGGFYEGEYFIGDRLTKIRPLRPYEGDITLEGRYVQSIRFGATTDIEKGAPNNWSNVGNVGDPIMIIRNGQYNDTNKEKFELIEEDISKDHSSIYLCSNQQITGFKPASNYDASYGEDIFKEIYGEEIVPSNEEMESDVEEDVSLTSADNFPAEELIKIDETAQLTDSTTSYYDTSPTDDQAIDVNNPTQIPDSTIVMNTQENQLENEIG